MEKEAAALRDGMEQDMCHCNDLLSLVGQLHGGVIQHSAEHGSSMQGYRLESKKVKRARRAQQHTVRRDGSGGAEQLQ